MMDHLEFSRFFFLFALPSMFLFIGILMLSGYLIEKVEKRLWFKVVLVLFWLVFFIVAGVLPFFGINFFRCNLFIVQEGYPDCIEF